MRKYIFLSFVLFCATITVLFSQTQKFRSGIFLHHSTGGCIWGPNGSSTSVPQEIAKYNSDNGLTGDNTVSLTEQWWPDSDNEWATWHNIFYNRDASNDIRPILETNKIVIIKSCFPSSSIWGVGSSSDTLNPEDKTIYNYKWHWRSIVKVMASHPENFFVIWTNAPLVANATSDEEAVLSDQFCHWAKDTLATGNDSVFGPFPLDQNYPNPFNPGTTIHYSVKKFGQVKLAVYNILGKLVRTLVNNEQPAGEYKIFWDGRDEKGNLVPGGIYFYRLWTGKDLSIAKRMILLK